jgi:hypothetical protein
LYCAGWEYTVAFTKVLTIYQYIILEFNPSIILLYPFSSLSTDIICPFISMCTHYFHHIHPPSPFPHLLYSHWYQTRAGPVPPSCSPILFKEKRRKK